MKPYQISLPNGKLGHVINKRLGIRRPTKILWFRYKNKERIIAYTIIVEGADERHEFMVFKTKRKGEWLNGARKNGESVKVDTEKKLSGAIKKAIDLFERKKGQLAYQELF